MRALLASDVRLEFKERLLEVIDASCRGFDCEYLTLDGEPVVFSEREMEYRIRAMSNMMLGMVEVWAEGGFAETPEEVSLLIISLLSVAPDRVPFAWLAVGPRTGCGRHNPGRRCRTWPCRDRPWHARPFLGDMHNGERKWGGAR